jgi:hypothetical protein
LPFSLFVLPFNESSEKKVLLSCFSKHEIITTILPLSGCFRLSSGHLLSVFWLSVMKLSALFANSVLFLHCAQHCLRHQTFDTSAQAAYLFRNAGTDK